ncbi:ubiquitin fusion degradation protein UFD1-domain-containing protein [Podospora didyma]|uniref:Ubiquitin fusion degradation protein UFD1-domain-containing protein n=1 Tax=Podospora didyma TaxID=330526 RepID=A0AAE0NSQ4_9PEZI|nr:ubiquitin fusion degradation protein UFD1-domain-containing protein [Podospora didyma]
MFNPPGRGGFDPSNPEHLYQMARGGMGRPRAAQRFDEYYRCYPMVMAPGAERPELNHGSKIFLPPSALDKVSRLHVQWPIMLELINGDKGKHTHGGVLEFVAEEGRAYIPHWMMKTLLLDVGDMIQIKTTSLELAKLVKLQPQTTNFLDITDPRAVLEKAFRNFAALTKGDIFDFEYNHEIYEMAVLDVKPETDKMGISMIETDVSVDFAPPVGYVEPERVPRAGNGTSTPRSGRGVGGGLPAGGLLHSQGTMAQAINYDAIAPSALLGSAGNFLGEGLRLKSTPVATPKASTPVAGASSNAPHTDSTQTSKRRAGPQPLRLPPNKLFLGYEIKPVKTAADKEREAADAMQPHFAGQGKTLRGVVKGKGEDDDKTPEKPEKPAKKPEESKGRRLDGRPS